MNKDYWEKRSLQMMKKIYNTQEKENKALVKLYKETLKDIKSEVETLYSKMDNVSLSEAYRYDRLKKIEKQLQDKITELAKEEVKIDKNILEKSYKDAYEQVSKNLKIDFTKVPHETVKKALDYPWSGSMFSEIVWKNNSQLAFQLKNTITKGLIEGKSYINMARELEKLMDNGIYNSLRVIRTETAHIVNQAALDRYNDANVKEVEWLAAEDERMCGTCGTLHGQKFKIEEFPDCPNHPMCRCTILPIVKI
ncbi:minor capsid protein [uncultured Clostridium sp.]|uniref:minor capsid protein n=1 Tax=uncultured Clostridium sp. TaxID=59620 RepID=UPI00260886AC|nr:minor capsid protein [uncultured Clostridium sp.]